MTERHVVVTDRDGNAVGRARIDLDKRVIDRLDQNGQGWELYRTKRGRVIARYVSQWANIPDKWVGNPRYVAKIMAEQGWDLEDADVSVVDELEEV